MTADGVEHAVDVIIYGTGFQASKFLTPDDRSPAAAASTCTSSGRGDARAYLGVTIPGFPNLFCLYGPNTNIVINGSIVYFSECGVRYILGLRRAAARGRPPRASTCARTCTTSSTNASTRENRMMAWGWSDVNSWYKNEHGHVAQNWPFTLLEYWQRPSRPTPTTTSSSTEPSGLPELRGDAEEVAGVAAEERVAVGLGQ